MSEFESKAEGICSRRSQRQQQIGVSSSPPNYLAGRLVRICRSVGRIVIHRLGRQDGGLPLGLRSALRALIASHLSIVASSQISMLLNLAGASCPLGVLWSDARSLHFSAVQQRRGRSWCGRSNQRCRSSDFSAVARLPRRRRSSTRFVAAWANSDILRVRT